MIKLSIVVGTLDRPRPFQNLLNSIVKNTTVPWELIVSDAGLDYPIDISKMPPNIKVIPERPRLTMTQGYNRAFRQAQGEWVVWLNDDAEVFQRWDVEAIGLMERNPWVGMGAFYWKNEGEEQYKVDWYQGMYYANFGILKKEFGEQIGWFDEDAVDMYGSDNSISFRVYLAGKPIVPIPNARIIHRPFVDRQRVENEKKQVQDATRLMQKYRPFLDDMKRVFHQYQNVSPI